MVASCSVISKYFLKSSGFSVRVAVLTIGWKFTASYVESSRRLSHKNLQFTN